jgi:DNA-binding CsgD family transcriptional regulator
MAKAPLTRHIEALSKAQTLRDAAPALADIGRAVGLDRPAVVEDFTGARMAMSRDSGLMGEIFGWPAECRAANGVSLHHLCPIGRACRVAVHPFAWRSADIGSADFAWGNESRAFWRCAADQGIVGGVTVPVHMPLSRVGAVGWLAIRRDVDLDEVIDLHGHELRLAAHLFMDHVYRERPELAGALPQESLSERELECLTWVALGKTDAEIGELIGRSPSTARFHVDSAVEKLGVNNRTRAAAVASQLGMIRALG